MPHRRYLLLAVRCRSTLHRGRCSHLSGLRGTGLCCPFQLPQQELRQQQRALQDAYSLNCFLWSI